MSLFGLTFTCGFLKSNRFRCSTPDFVTSIGSRILGNVGRQGRHARQFHHSHSIASDSEGNLYIAETQGKRVQRFLFKGV